MKDFKDKVLFENALRDSQREEELVKKDFTSLNVYDQAKANADAQPGDTVTLAGGEYDDGEG